ncbi:DUF4157 domain-containing protein [Corallococcus terminator]
MPTGQDVPLAQELPYEVRRKLERFFGASFSDVRVHISQAPALLGAEALAHGNDLYFRPGRYQPFTSEGQRLLGHELTHVLQQRVGRHEGPHARGLVLDKALEDEADAMGAAVAEGAWSCSRQDWRRARPLSRQAARIIQPYVIVKSKELTRDDIKSTMVRVMKELESLDAFDAPFPSIAFAAREKRLWEWARQYPELLEAKLEAWVESSGEKVSTLFGSSQSPAEWRQYESIAELAVALAHETHPGTLANLEREVAIADYVIKDPFINGKLSELRKLIYKKLEQVLPSYTRLAFTIQRALPKGSYKLQSKWEDFFHQPLTEYEEGTFEQNIMMLHDMMEQLSSTRAGGTGSVVGDTLPDPRPQAYRATQLTSQGLMRVVRKTGKNEGQIQKLQKGLVDTRIAVTKERRGRQDMIDSSREDGNERLALARMGRLERNSSRQESRLTKKQERLDVLLEDNEPVVDIRAKGRRNVGTRAEEDPDTVTARLFSAPIMAGRSMTTARLLEMADWAGSNNAQNTALVYAIFAYWRRLYNRGKTPIHTFHEVMDVAFNYGIAYQPFHYPEVELARSPVFAYRKPKWTRFYLSFDVSAYEVEQQRISEPEPPRVVEMSTLRRRFKEPEQPVRRFPPGKLKTD